MAQNTARAQKDVAVAFSVTKNRIFSRANNQIYSIVGHNPDMKLVTTVWFDRFDSEREFRDVHEYALELFRTGSYELVFADLRFQATGFESSADWLKEVFMPTLFANGLKREAVVLAVNPLPPEVKAVSDLTARLMEAEGDPRIRGFTDIAAAKKWLLSGEEPKA